MEKEPKIIPVKDVAKDGENIEKKSNVVELETSNARYSIVYSLHNIPNRPEVIEGADGIILEFIGNYQTPKNAEKTSEFLLKANQYKEVIKLAVEKQKPIYLVDLSMDTRLEHNLSFPLKNALLPFIEAAAAGGLIFSGIKNLNKQRNISRRDFLKLGAKIGVASYLSLPQASRIFSNIATGHFKHEPDEKSFSRKAEKFSHKLEVISHPELYSILNTRNDLIAEKSEAIAKMIKEEVGRKPQLSILIGAGHTGLEDSFITNFDQRLVRLRNDLGQNIGREKFIAQIKFEPNTGNSPQKYSIAILEYPSLN